MRADYYRYMLKARMGMMRGSRRLTDCAGGDEVTGEWRRTSIEMLERKGSDGVDHPQNGRTIGN